MTLTTSKSKTTLYFDHIGYTVWDSYKLYRLSSITPPRTLLYFKHVGRGGGRGLKREGWGLIKYGQEARYYQF